MVGQANNALAACSCALGPHLPSRSATSGLIAPASAMAPCVALSVLSLARARAAYFFVEFISSSSTNTSGRMPPLVTISSRAAVSLARLASAFDTFWRTVDAASPSA